MKQKNLYFFILTRLLSAFKNPHGVLKFLQALQKFLQSLQKITESAGTSYLDLHTNFPPFSLSTPKPQKHHIRMTQKKHG